MISYDRDIDQVNLFIGVQPPIWVFFCTSGCGFKEKKRNFSFIKVFLDEKRLFKIKG